MTDKETIAWLRDLKTVRSQSARLFDLAQANALPYFKLNRDKLPFVCDEVIKVTALNYPNGDIPYHSRWRHFEADTSDKITQIKADIQSPKLLARALTELVIVSVLLDAGAGPDWSYKTENGIVYSRSEGLALASLDWYLDGGFSHQDSPYHVDASCLMVMGDKNLLSAFQVNEANPLLGVEGRVGLLNRLGQVISSHPEWFGHTSRLGGFFDYLWSLSDGKTISASTIFQAVLTVFADVWPKRNLFQGVALGDAWHYPELKTSTIGSDWVPFHKLSQWLTYSLLEPLEWAGLEVTDMDALTGLPEYRNGGLFIDGGVLVPQVDDWQNKVFEPDEPFIVAWRGLTVVLLDKLASNIRLQWGLDAASLPLAKILQGGTWETGRKLAKLSRPDGGPPIKINSDGTIF